MPLAEVATIQNKVLQGGCAGQVKYSLENRVLFPRVLFSTYSCSAYMVGELTTADVGGKADIL